MEALLLGKWYNLRMNKLAVEIGKSFNSPFGQTKGVGSLVKTIIDTSFVVSGIIILFMFVYAGIMMIQSAGSGKADNAEKAKQAATYAAIGFAIIFVSYWLIRLIEVITGSPFVTSPTF